LIASIPATTADPACCATPCATRVTREIGVEESARRLFEPPDALRVVAGDLAADALRVAELLPAPRFDEGVERLLAVLLERREPALREVLDALAADLPCDFPFLDPDFLALRDEALLPDFARDFLALVAIDASPRSR
jgi:hypothetical protein